MSKLISNFAQDINAMIAYRVALGLSANTLTAQLTRFDRYCAEHHPDCAELSKDLAFEWLNSRVDAGNAAGSDASAIRQLGEYLNAIGKPAYILPHGLYCVKSDFAAYIFTDTEMAALFGAIDTLPCKAESTECIIAPVLFRLIYTCGLRPNEGRVLLTENINLETGEVYVTNTKKKKDRIVVMSPDMRVLCGQHRKRRLPDSEYFFPRFDGGAYTAAQIDTLFKRCWANANPGVSDIPSVRTYDLRHRFASARLNRWLDEGANLNNKLAYLRVYMGHKRLSETAHYIHMLPENLVKSAGVDWNALNDILPGVTAWEK